MSLRPIFKRLRARPLTRGRRASARLSGEALEDRVVPTTFNWVGRDALQPTYWSRPANWSPQGVPGLGDDVIIAHPTFQSLQDIRDEINNLTVSNLSTLATGLAGLLTVDGTATIDNSTLALNGSRAAPGIGLRFERWSS
jgi:hypothetical protein